MATNRLEIIFGGALLAGAAPGSGSVEATKTWLDFVGNFDFIKVIDTATIYGETERLFGDAGASSRFSIHTKHPGGLGPEPSTKESIISSFKRSLELLKVDSLDVYYMHAPDTRVSWKETLEGLNELHQQGLFKRLGLSNFLGSEVEEMIQVAKENNYVVPSVYQGNYSAVARVAEEQVFPVLRKYDIPYYAYSPIAGGFLSKTKAELVGPDNRFGKGDKLSAIYNGMYNKPSYVDALDVWGQIAEEEGVSRAELAYRWVVYHSALSPEHGDAVIVGASRETQLTESINAIKKGPLSDAAVGKIQKVWESVKPDAQLDNFQMLRNRPN